MMPAPTSESLTRNDEIVELATDVRAMRRVRELVMLLAYRLADSDGNKRAYLILVEPRISQSRIDGEWRALKTILAPDIVDRITLVPVRQSTIPGRADDLPSHIAELALGARSQHAGRASTLQRPDYFAEVAKILLRRMFFAEGPVSMSGLRRQAGCSYPTVAQAIARLGPVVRRESNRSVELCKFPEKAWAQLLATSERSRQTIAFSDRSGSPRTVKALCERLAGQRLAFVAVGGTRGARRWYRELDIAGDVRLDLSVHSPERRVHLDFIRRMDPALKRVSDPSAPRLVVLHFVRRQDSEFDASSQPPWADPVECLWDLYELGLESQASSFRHFLSNGGLH